MGGGGEGGEISRRLFTIDFQEGEGGGGSLEYCRTLEGDQLNIIMLQSKSSDLPFLKQSMLTSL